MSATKKPSCAVPQCLQRFSVKRYFFRFPKEHDRWLQWVHACGRLDLEPKGPEYAYQNCRLCHLHFENKWYNVNKVRARLHPDAIPIIFFRPDFKQQNNTTMENEQKNIFKEKIDRNTCAEATIQVQENNNKAETSKIFVPIAVSNVEIAKASTLIKRTENIRKKSDNSPRKLQLKLKKLKAQNKALRETIRRLRMEKRRKLQKLKTSMSATH